MSLLDRGKGGGRGGGNDRPGHCSCDLSAKESMETDHEILGP